MKKPTVVLIHAFSILLIVSSVFAQEKEPLDNECTKNCTEKESACQQACSSRFGGLEESVKNCVSECFAAREKCNQICDNIHQVDIRTENNGGETREEDKPVEKAAPSYFSPGEWRSSGDGAPSEAMYSKAPDAKAAADYRTQKWRSIWINDKPSKKGAVKEYRTKRMNGLKPISDINIIRP